MTRWTSLARCAAAGIAVAAVALSPLLVRAAPLAKEACDQLAAEKARLVAAGVADRMSKGPIWGKANLAAEKLSEIERFIEVEEQLSFRCGLARVKLAPEPPEPMPDPDAAPATPPPVAPKRRPPKRPDAKAPALTAPPAAPAIPKAAPAAKKEPPASVAPFAPKPAKPRPKPAPAASPDAPAKAAPAPLSPPPG